MNVKNIMNAGLTEFISDMAQGLTKNIPWMKEREFILCRNVEQLAQFIDEAIKTGRCSLDLETTGLNSRMKNGKPLEKIVGFCLSHDPKTGMYVPISHKEGSEQNLPEEMVLAQIQRLVASCVIIYHNAKFDLSFLRNYGITVTEWDKIEDTQLLARLYDAGQKDIKLKSLSEKLLNQKMITFEEISGASKRFDFIPPEVAYTYGCSDAVCTLDLFNFFMSQSIIKEQAFIYKLERKVVFVVMQMENNLFKIDVPYLEGLKVETERKIEEIKKEIFKLANREFNLASPIQLGKVLFEDLKFPHPLTNPRTASGQWATDTATLKKIARDFPVVKRIVQFRELEKSLGTYINNLLKNHDEEGCVKLGFSQAGTDTGRFSSPGGDGIDADGYCGVNVQSLPANYDEGSIAPDIRKAFIARPGYKIVALDYSGEELRVAANLSREPSWVGDFLNDGDLHAKTAQIIYNKQEVTKAERQNAKTFNFSILYGAGPQRLSEVADVSITETRKMLAAYFQQLPVLKRWIDEETRRARANKYVKTIWGRKRPLAFYYDSGDKGMEKHADRCAVNTLIQGGCADIMKVAMTRIHTWINAQGYQDHIRILLTMHDELVFEIREDMLDFFIPQLNHMMLLKGVLQDGFKWPVPLKIDAEYGDSWHVDNDYFKKHPEARTMELPEAPVFSNELKPVNRYDIAIKQVSNDSTSQPEPVIPAQLPFDIKETIQADSTAASLPDPEPHFASVKNTQNEIDTKIKENLIPKEGEDIIFIVPDLSKSMRNRLNMLLTAIEDHNLYFKDWPTNRLVIRDQIGNSFLVDDVFVNPFAFWALVTFIGF